MKKMELRAILSNKTQSYCDIRERSESSITFSVDEVEPRCGHIENKNVKDIVHSILWDKNITKNQDVVCSGMDAKKVGYVGADVLYRCVLQCYSEHRPLVLSPDAVWLVVNQAIAYQINSNPEKYRDIVVCHEGKMELVVKTAKDILHDSDVDWMGILDGFYSQISAKTKDGIATQMACDFTTTNTTSRIASIITLMDAMQSFFTYVVLYCICGIPTITLTGTADDWRKLQQKLNLLKKFDLGWWYDYLHPVIGEFIEAASGSPNKYFWKSIVMMHQAEDFDHNKAGGCTPWDRKDVKVDGWFLVFFPFIDGKKQSFVSHSKDVDMDSEMARVPFKYKVTDGENILSTTDMELWAGLMGVEENPETFALTPRAGWFVRVSHEMRSENDPLIIMR